MKYKELSNLDIKKVNSIILKEKKKLLSIKYNNFLSRVKNTSDIKKIKINIARCKTFLKKKK